jgi:hypothetical protein
VDRCGGVDFLRRIFCPGTWDAERVGDFSRDLGRWNDRPVELALGRDVAVTAVWRRA